MAGQSDSVHQGNSGEALDEICEWCWDEDKKSIPATTMLAGIPLCAMHSKQSAGQSRFDVNLEREENDFGVVVSIPKCPRRPDDISPAQMKARENKMAEEPKSIQLFKPGGTEDEFAKGLGTLMQDILTGRVTTEQADAACHVADRVIRIIEIRIKQDWRENGGGG